MTWKKLWVWLIVSYSSTKENSLSFGEVRVSWTLARTFFVISCVKHWRRTVDVLSRVSFARGSKDMRVQLVSPLPDRGFAFNEGAYWPVGLLTIGSFVRRHVKEVEVEILDESLIGSQELERRLGADVVGIQANSNLTYRRVLELSLKARDRKSTLVVLGGPYASMMPHQILKYRHSVDGVVTGPGEMAMVDIIKAALRGSPTIEMASIPGLLTRGNLSTCSGGNDDLALWSYEAARPIDYSLIPVDLYHANYRRRLCSDYQGSFQIFTHFGCRYRDSRRLGGKSWCSYCALGERLIVREPNNVRNEITEALVATGMKDGSRLMLKCYGDNASALGEPLLKLANCLREDAYLKKFDLSWSMYAQSSFVTPRLVEAFLRLGVAEVYIGFDSVDDGIQKLNGLGTSRATHLRAATLLRDAGIRLQAGFVLGCEGESPSTLAATVEFCEELHALGNVQLFHASPLVVLAGSGAFSRLSAQIPELTSIDYVDPEYLQREWLSRFCPELGSGEDAQRVVREVANSIAALGQIRSSFGGGTSA
jgi:radical SAM superfamily enzyme YgiQ (UPF0313 family)